MGFSENSQILLQLGIFWEILGNSSKVHAQIKQIQQTQQIQWILQIMHLTQITHKQTHLLKMHVK